LAIKSRTDRRGTYENGLMPSRLLEGKVAIITGASRGIGAAAARRFAEAGASVVLAARTAKDIENVAEEIEASGGRALAVATDVTDERQVEELVKRAVATYGRLDLAFNNAGAGHMPQPLADITVDDFVLSIKVNLIGVFIAMKFEIPAMVEAGGGAIVNMSSSAGLQGAPGLGDYAAAKHGVVGLTKSAALDYGRHNVRVNAIAPGPIVNEQMAQLPEEARRQIAQYVPLGRLGNPDQVAGTVAWLCSEEASFISGAVLSVDGGRLAGSLGRV
jgi:NAD(P)-dependent dehydrogenase (short-subunit alcohol dehydrogenase family)